MNRKGRRARLKHGPPGAARAPDAGSQINKMFQDAFAFDRAGKLDEAARAYKRIVALNAGHAEAHNNLARVLHAQGKTKDASACYARARPDAAALPAVFRNSRNAYVTSAAARRSIATADGGMAEKIKRDKAFRRG